jgi:putative Mg2+ transporter-C (MgtC) family protein
LALRGLESNDLNGSGRVCVTAHLTASQRVDADLEKIVGRLSLEPAVTATSWQAEVRLDSEARSSLEPR